MANMQAEALGIALEALEYIHEGANNQGPHTGISWRCVAVKAEPAIKAIKQARALDKKAENARELGLDYEPVQDKVTLIQTNVGIGERAMEAYEAAKERDRAALAAPTVQEPVAFFYPGQGFYWAKPTKIIAPVTVDVKPLPLYTTPPAAKLCPPCNNECEQGRNCPAREDK
jgi:hypothetical protein